MKRKPERGIDLICQKHGETAAVVGACAPSDKQKFEVTCKGSGRRKSCRHHEYASEKQVAGILRAYPACDAREYQPDPWKALFED